VKKREMREELIKLKNKARKKGWVLNGMSTDHPIDHYLSKKDFERWYHLAIVEELEE